MDASINPINRPVRTRRRRYFGVQADENDWENGFSLSEYIDIEERYHREIQRREREQ